MENHLRLSGWFAFVLQEFGFSEGYGAIRMFLKVESKLLVCLLVDGNLESLLSQSHSSEKELHKPSCLNKVHSPVETRWSFLSAVRASIQKV